MPTLARRRVTLPLLVVAIATTALAVVLVVRILTSVTQAPVPVAGLGDVVSEDRPTGAITGIDVTGGINVVVGTGTATSVTVAAQANLVKLVRTVVSDGQLVVTVPAPGITSTSPITLTVQVPDLQSVTLDGGATGTIETMGGSLTVDVNAGSSLRAIGQVDSIAITASDRATAGLGELVAGSATVRLTGGSSAELHVTGTVTGTADSGSTLKLTTRPAGVKVTTSGGASVLGG
jgi:hypothetical protein